MIGSDRLEGLAGVLKFLADHIQFLDRIFNLKFLRKRSNTFLIEIWDLNDRPHLTLKKNFFP